jgi:hypothetical protein
MLTHPRRHEIRPRKADTQDKVGFSTGLSVTSLPQNQGQVSSVQKRALIPIREHYWLTYLSHMMWVNARLIQGQRQSYVKLDIWWIFWQHR